MSVVQRPRAKADLAEIWKYIAEDSEGRADAFIDTIDEKFQMLARQPSMGRRREERLKDQWQELKDLALTDVSLEKLSVESQIAQFAKITASLRTEPTLRRKIRERVNPHTITRALTCLEIHFYYQSGFVSQK